MTTETKYGISILEEAVAIFFSEFVVLLMAVTCSVVRPVPGKEVTDRKRVRVVSIIG